MRKRATAAVQDIQDTEWYDMSKKFFYLDHTAEVLENYRRLHENEIFDRILHDERQKRAFLKHESRREENLIANFDQKFKNHQYLANTSEQQDHIDPGFNSSISHIEQSMVYRSLKGLPRHSDSLKIDLIDGQEGSSGPR